MSEAHPTKNVFKPKTVHEECLRSCRPSIYDGRPDVEEIEEFLALLCMTTFLAKKALLKATVASWYSHILYHMDRHGNDRFAEAK